MRLRFWRKRTKDNMFREEDDTARRLAASSRAVEQSQKALDKVDAQAPRVQAHHSSIRRVAEDNGLAGIILYGFRQGTR
jgi:hypothetical protein